MIPIKRFPEPEVLAKHKAKWTMDFLEQRKNDPKARPRSERYAHTEVKATLETMSHHKCFYCEASTKEERPQVDHHLEVAEKPEMAFEWTNLYLACPGCNSAKNRSRNIHAGECVDPCLDGVRPADHLAFEGELIRTRNNSPAGLNTIQKYWLNRDELDLKRMRVLRLLDRVVKAIDDARIRDGGRAMTAEEVELLRRFAQPDAPFSLMCHDHLDGLFGKTPGQS